MAHRTWLLAFLFIVLVFTRPTRADDQAPDQGSRAKLDDGYSLLDKLMNDEKQLELILIVKTTPPKVADLAKRISKEAGQDGDTLESFQGRDQALKLDKVSLPQVELDVRDSIRDEKQHNMLFDRTGPDFARYLLLSQIEASTYGIHLAKVLATNETSSARARALTKMSDRWRALRHEAYGLLMDN